MSHSDLFSNKDVYKIDSFYNFTTRAEIDDLFNTFCSQAAKKNQIPDYSFDTYSNSEVKITSKAVPNSQLNIGIDSEISKTLKSNHLFQSITPQFTSSGKETYEDGKMKFSGKNLLEDLNNQYHC